MAIKICLDAGHYGKYNQSPAVKTYYESEMNWKLHNLLKNELEKYGFEVITTRAKQAVDLEVTLRGKASKGCDLFLSLHSNAVAGGVNETYDYPVAIVQVTGKGNKLGEKLANVVQKTIGTKQAGRVVTKKNSVGGDWYGVLRGAAAVGTMGIILEHSFHTNTAATKWLMDDGNLAKMAKAEAEVIADYYGVKKQTATKTLYRIQLGAFSDKKNADTMLAKVKAAGFKDAYIEAK